MMKHIMPCALILMLAGCGGQFSNPFEKAKPVPKPAAPLDAPVSAPVSAPASRPVEVGTSGQTAASLDTTTDAEKAAATKAPVGAATLGTTVASLGDVTEQGFWLRTPLVKSETQGSLKTEGGATVNVTLIPLDGPVTAGSQISLAAMRALNLGLTDLATLTVSRS